ncbi:hypothetical protein Taro_055916 [Colocasia esculenta]|uniref:Uncharacterized protein n=1 Tax=Colocasia esculenta TaxID=4460 RepID=A0A843XVQ6_COLES|nr:hypothetical protein [Colocasia esculenta]
MVRPLPPDPSAQRRHLLTDSLLCRCSCSVAPPSALHRHQLGLPCRAVSSLAREAPGEGRPTSFSFSASEHLEEEDDDSGVVDQKPGEGGIVCDLRRVPTVSDKRAGAVVDGDEVEEPPHRQNHGGDPQAGCHLVDSSTCPEAATNQTRGGAGGGVGAELLWYPTCDL